MALNEKTKADCKQAFSIYDADADGFIATKELPTLLRIAGVNPTPTQLQAYSAELKDRFDFTQYCAFVAKQQQEEQTLTQKIQQTLKLFDHTGSDSVSIVEVRHLLAKVGDLKLHGEDVAEILREVDVSVDGQIKIEHLARVMVGAK